MSYLRKVAQQGAETHELLKSQDAKIDEERCKAAFAGLKNMGDRPDVTGVGGQTAEWNEQIQQFFVDSCVSGKPKPVPGESVGQAPSGTSSSTPSPTPSTASG
ncbi:hypothetical protein [Lentzea flava]|nr:hypothetical protein [Lentzea flava]MCP2200910.1 hypothetical protein [Lentzea flava]